MWPYFEAVLHHNHYAEPFAGGGSTFLHVARERPKLRLSINDKDPDVANFWAVVCGPAVDFNTLCAQVEASRGPTDDPERRLAYWFEIRDSDSDDPALKAFRFLFLNKTCFGGGINNSPMGGYDQSGWQGRGGRGLASQYNVETILTNLHEARRLLKGRTTVTSWDAFEFLRVTESAFFYFDPPYVLERENCLYRCVMTMAEHQHLANLLRQFPDPWLLSYDDNPAIHQLYSWANIIGLEARYSGGRGWKNWKSKIELIVIPKKHAEFEALCQFMGFDANERNRLRVSLYTTDSPWTNPQIARDLIHILGSDYFKKGGDYLVLCGEIFGWLRDEVEKNIEKCIEVLTTPGAH